MRDTSWHGFEAGSWQEAVYDVLVGIYIGFDHGFAIVRLFCWKHLLQPLLRWCGVDSDAAEATRAGDGSLEDRKLKVVGVGYGRTGTYSLTLALEELGYPCLHTQHLYENEEIFRMWTTKIFHPSIEANHATLGEPDLELIAAKGYQATADLPTALYFEQIYRTYPDCKFILTTRENSQVWFKSWDTLTMSISQATFWGGMYTRRVYEYSNYLRWLFALVNKDDSYLTTPLPLPNQNEKEAIASYEEHNRRVREVIPPDQLLEYNVKQGWEPLCKFLEVDNCPTIPFPKSNSARSVQVQSHMSYLVPLAIISIVAFYLFAFVIEKVTRKKPFHWINHKMDEFSRYLMRSSGALKLD